MKIWTTMGHRRMTTTKTMMERTTRMMMTRTMTMTTMKRARIVEIVKASTSIITGVSSTSKCQWAIRRTLDKRKASVDSSDPTLRVR